MAWGIVTSVLPPVSISEKIHFGTVVIFFWSMTLVFIRTAFFDILDMQGDRIVGKETLPILLGEKRSLFLLKTILALNFSMLLISGALHIISNLGFALAICPVFVFVVLSAHERGYMLPGIRLEFLVESNFVLAGVITLIWSLI